MNGHLVKYLYYDKIGKSQVTLPRKFLEAEKIDWKHNDDVYLVAIEHEGRKGVFIYRKEERETYEKTRANAIELESKI